MKKGLSAIHCSLRYMGAGWPENYGGVMLQDFYWNLFGDSQWSSLEGQADELLKNMK
jgi:alpha-amylase